VQCKWLKKWIKKCDDDSETSNWIAANTRVEMLCLRISLIVIAHTHTHTRARGLRCSVSVSAS